MNLAGMQSQWVISAHIPKVERKSSKRNMVPKSKDEPTSKKLADNDLIRNVKSICQLNVEPGSELLKVLYEINYFRIKQRNLRDKT